MTDFLANDYAAIERRRLEIKGGIEPAARKIDCTNCDDVGWICVQIGPPPVWDCCWKCQNRTGRAQP